MFWVMSVDVTEEVNKNVKRRKNGKIVTGDN